jgi:hypothetical protein
MVIVILINGIVFGSFRIADKNIKDYGKIGFNLTEEQLEMIELIEEFEIIMIKKGLNPDTLTLKQFYQYLKEERKKQEEQTPKKKLYTEFLEKIKEKLVSLE